MSFWYISHLRKKTHNIWHSNVSSLACVFTYIHSLCMRVEKGPASLHICGGSPDHWLLVDAISTKVSCAGSVYSQKVTLATIHFLHFIPQKHCIFDSPGKIFDAANNIFLISPDDASRDTSNQNFMQKLMQFFLQCTYKKQTNAYDQEMPQSHIPD